jgi:hypothetical protein
MLNTDSKIRVEPTGTRSVFRKPWDGQQPTGSPQQNPGAASTRSVFHKPWDGQQPTGSPQQNPVATYGHPVGFFANRGMGSSLRAPPSKIRA